MDDRRYEKLAAATGIVFVVLLIAGVFAVPKSPPKIDDPITKIGRFYVAHHNGLLWGAFIGGLASLFGLWFLGTVVAYLRRNGAPRLATIAFGGAIAATAAAGVAGIVGVTLAYLVGQNINAADARILFDMGTLLITGIWIPVAVFMAATSMAIMRTRSLPAWIWQTGAVIAVLEVLASASLFAHSGFFAPGGTSSLIALGLFGLWMLALSITLIGRIGEPPDAAAMAAERPAVAAA